MSARSVDILLVEDDPDTLFVTRDLLEAEGWRVAVTADGCEALGWLEQHAPPGLILLDRMMPHLNGAELIDRLAGDPRWAQVPVVVVSANGARAGLPRAMPVLRKPVDLDQLLGLVQKVLTPSELGDTAEHRKIVSHSR